MLSTNEARFIRGYILGITCLSLALMGIRPVQTPRDRGLFMPAVLASLPLSLIVLVTPLALHVGSTASPQGATHPHTFGTHPWFPLPYFVSSITAVDALKNSVLRVGRDHDRGSATGCCESPVVKCPPAFVGAEIHPIAHC